MLRPTDRRADPALAGHVARRRPIVRRAIPSWLALVAGLALIAPGPAAAAGTPASASGVTVSGTITIPPSTYGSEPGLAGMRVRVEGTWIETLVDPATGQFTLTGVPAGVVPLLLVEPPQFDSFTQESKHTVVNVGPGGASGVGFALVYHWQDLPGHPPHWGEAAYGEWTAQFASAQVGFVMFRVRASGPDPERIELHRTTDGGLTWSRIGLWVAEPGWTLFPDIYRTFHFTDADHGLVLAVAPCIPCGACGSGFFRTTDGGASWSFVPLPVPPNSYALGVVRFAEAGPGRLIVLGSSGCAVQGYGGLFWDVLWETNDGGASWTIGTDWTPSTGCTALGAYPDGRALALCTPYGSGGGPAAARAANGTWTISNQSAIVANSGYGPSDLPRGGDWLLVSNVGAGLPRGLYRTSNLGSSWEFLSDPGARTWTSRRRARGSGFSAAPRA